MNKRRNERIGALFVMLSAILFGTMPFFTKIAYRYGSNPVTAAFGRFMFGSIGAALVVALSPGMSFFVPKEKRRSILLLSVLYALTPVLLFTSYAYIDSGPAMTMHFTYPVVVVLIMGIFFKERFTGSQIICTALCFSGIALLHMPIGSINLFGAVSAVASGICYALYIIFLGRSKLQSQGVLTVTFWIAFLSCIEIGLFGLVSRQLVFSIGVQAWLAEAVLGIMATVMALALFQKGVFLCGEFKASLLSTLEPLTGVAIGIAVFHEKLTAYAVIGVIFVLGAGVLLVLTGRRKKGNE